jgi:prepilin-type N-terminal cleavage/methylation domain-containing protein
MTARSGDGFTMVELVLVITLLGLLAWIAYPKFATFYEIKIDAAARRVAADVRYAQSQAIATRKVHGLLFEPGLGRYTVFAPAPATPVTDPADRSKPLRVDFATKTEYQGVTLSSASFGTTPGVKFDYFGVPLDTSGVELAATGRVVLTYQGYADTIEVSPGTGKVTVK